MIEVIHREVEVNIDYRHPLVPSKKNTCCMDFQFALHGRDSFRIYPT